MSQSFLSRFIGNLEQQDVLFGNEKLVIVDTEDGKVIPLTVLVEYIDEANSYKPGDVVSIKANTPMAGFISSSSKIILFSIPLDKTVNATSFTIACPDITVRGITGYLIQDTDIEEYTVKTYISNHMLSVAITSETAFDVTNNTPVSVEGTMKITFK